jgi:hypothetical protein
VGSALRRRVPPDEDDENYHVFMEAAMQDVPPGSGDLPPGYQALVAGGYDEESLFQQVLEASKADEDEVCPGYSEAIKLTGLVTNHVASLPRLRGAGDAAAARSFVPLASP